MLSNGQTLKHKKTNKLVRLVPEQGEMWAWNVGKKTAFIAEDGTKFTDDIDNYTNIEDELGRPYSKQPAEGQFVDESAKKYLVSEKELAKMRRKKLKEWEAEVLSRMAGNVKAFTYTCDGELIITSCDSPGKSVHCPFEDGSKSFLFRDFFLKRRGSVPLYKEWSSIMKKYISGPMVFRHTDGQLWLYDRMLYELKVIKEGTVFLQEAGLGH